MIPGFFLFLIAISGLSSNRAKPIRVADAAKNNIEVRLLATRYSDKRGSNYLAKFETTDKNHKIMVCSFPSHSSTVHESTLYKLMDSIPREKKKDEKGWSIVSPEYEVIFSIPKLGTNQGAGYNWETTFLVSLKLSRDK
jgi:hypothetical protein